MHGCKACLETERTALLEIKSFFISAAVILGTMTKLLVHGLTMMKECRLIAVIIGRE
ncbi:hypothetical protein WN944_022438 [Citrus x changshan-huyou]|uniref:Uncharacterized protein n=1 Tax=Citrus x changshan-huyou TaxID=2935761 RepID=A0AAP0N2Y9_9ROSI